MWQIIPQFRKKHSDKKHVSTSIIPKQLQIVVEKTSLSKSLNSIFWVIGNYLSFVSQEAYSGVLIKSRGYI